MSDEKEMAASEDLMNWLLWHKYRVVGAGVGFAVASMLSAGNDVGVVLFSAVVGGVMGWIGAGFIE